MKTIFKTLFVLSIPLLINSCRTIQENIIVEHEKDLPRVPISVKVNFRGILNEGETGLDPVYKYDNDGIGLFITNTLSDFNPDSDLDLNAKYKILVYENLIVENSNFYIFRKEKEFIRNEVNPTIELIENRKYTFIVVSSGTEKSVEVDNSKSYEKVNIKTSDITEILYDKIDNFTANKEEQIDIKLKKSITYLDVNIERYINLSVSDRILSLPKAYIEYNKPQEINLKDFTYSSFKIEKIPSLKIFDEERKVKTPAPIPLLINDENKDSVKLFADMELIPDVGFETTMTKNLDLHLEIQKGQKQTFEIKVLICGAFIGDSFNFREFMCCNLGESCVGGFFDGGSNRMPMVIWNYTSKPNLYAWGKKDVIFPFNRESPYDGSENSIIWPENEDPCPEGYRIPTKLEWDLTAGDRRGYRGYLQLNRTLEFDSDPTIHVSHLFLKAYKMDEKCEDDFWDDKVDFCEHFYGYTWLADTYSGSSRANHFKDALHVDLSYDDDTDYRANYSLSHTYIGRKSHPKAIRCIKK